MKRIFLTFISLLFAIDAYADSYPPVVSLLTPGNNTFAARTAIKLSAIALDGDGINKVEFYVDGGSVPIATVTTIPYQFSWQNVSPGVHTVKAKATDNTGATNTTTTSTITIFSYLGKVKADSTVAGTTTNPATVTATFANLAALKSDNNTCNGKVVYLQGFATAGDGGQGWLYGVSSSASTPDDIIEVNNQLCGFKKLHSNDLNIKLAGAKGDGTTDDTAAIQKVLDTHFNIVADAATDTYLVSTTTKLSTIGYKAALVPYSGQKIDLNGSTVKLADGANSSVIMNDALYSASGSTLTGASAPAPYPIDCTDDAINDGLDDCLVIRNGTIDGNVANQRITGLGSGSAYAFAPTIYLGNLKRSAVVDLTVKNFYASGIYFGGDNAKHVVTDIALNNIVVQDGVGVGVAVNGTRFTSDSIDISGTVPFSETTPAPPWGVYPNSITIAADDSDFGTVRADNCAWGFKLQDGSSNNHFTKIWVTGTNIQQAVKFQGTPSSYNEDTRVDEIISENNFWNGLYIVYQKGLQIGSYTGTNNGLGWVSGANAFYYRDIAILQSSLNIDTATINSPMIGAIDSRGVFPSPDTTPNTRTFGTINISNQKNADLTLNIDGGYHTVDKIYITNTAPLPSYIVYNKGAYVVPGGSAPDLDGYFGVHTIDSDQPLASGVNAFQVVQLLTGHTFFRADCVRLGTSASWQQATDTTITSATATCPL